MELDPQILAYGVVWYAVFLFSTTLHEAAHAFVALRLGDPTAYHGGQVTLNPMPHIQREPVGTVLVPILTFFMLKGRWMMGWASAPYDPVWADRHPRRAAWMALAGPVSNLALVVLAGLSIRLGMLSGVLEPPAEIVFSRITVAAEPGLFTGVASVLSILFSLNLLLFVFNLLPLPPLDGAAVLPLFIAENLARRYSEFMRQPGFGLLGILVAWQLIGSVIGPIQLLAINLLYPEFGYH